METLQKEYNVNPEKFICIGYGENYPLIDILKLDPNRIKNLDVELQYILNINRRCT